jgi:hypothetical protein
MVRRACRIAGITLLIGCPLLILNGFGIGAGGTDINSVERLVATQQILCGAGIGVGGAVLWYFADGLRRRP